MNQNNDQNELRHHGVKGMRWGVRKSTQNSSSNGSRNRKRINPFTKKKLEQTKRITDASSTIVNEMSKINRKSAGKRKTQLDLSKMTDKELRDRINRAHLEKQYNDMFNPKEVSKGRETVGKILEGAGTVLTIGGSALSIALAIKELRK